MPPPAADRERPSVARQPYRVGRARGYRYGEVPAEIAELLPRWIEARAVHGGVEIKPGRAYRYGAWMVKLSGPSDALRDVFRASPAVRAAQWHAELPSIATPRPLVALEWRRRGWLEGSLGVAEFVDGRTLAQVWRVDASATAAFPMFMARMHRARVFHGDLHPSNLLWNGSEWVLIDLDSLRHGLHALRGRRIAEAQWARVLRGLDFDEGVRAAFASYVARMPPRASALDAWPRIVARARAMPPR